MIMGYLYWTLSLFLEKASPFPLLVYPIVCKNEPSFSLFHWHEKPMLLTYLQVYRCPFYSVVVPVDELWSDCFTPAGLTWVIISEFGTKLAHKPII